MESFPLAFIKIQQIGLPLISLIFDYADQYKKKIRISPFEDIKLINRPTVATLFFENSSRTKYSFVQASQKLGINCYDFDITSSSINKGESIEETLKTIFYQGTDLVITRSKDENVFEQIGSDIPVKIINAGNGIDQHPTQALLDVFTMKEIGINFKNFKITILGDIAHSRVAGSLIPLLQLMGATVILSGPKECILENKFENITVIEDIHEAIRVSDAIYALRIQKERHQSPVSYYDTFNKDFGLTIKRFEKVKKSIPVFHPGPVNVGVEISPCVIQSNLYKGYEQVLNSTFIRMALLDIMCASPSNRGNNEYKRNTIS